jgi:hypothetical protein
LSAYTKYSKHAKFFKQILVLKPNIERSDIAFKKARVDHAGSSSKALSSRRGIGVEKEIGVKENRQGK